MQPRPRIGQRAPRPAARRAGRRHRAAGLESPVSGEFVLSHAPTTRRAGSKPFLLEGLNAESGDWEPTGIRPALQRAAGRRAAGQPQRRAQRDRVFRVRAQAMQALADALGAHGRLARHARGRRARASELDGFAGPLDAQLTVRLHGQRSVAWSVGYVQQMRGAPGLRASGAVPGRLVLPSPEDDAPPVLVLAFDARRRWPRTRKPPRCAMSRSPRRAADGRQRRTVPRLAAGGAQRWPTTWTPTLVDDRAMPITLHAFEPSAGN